MPEDKNSNVDLNVNPNPDPDLDLDKDKNLDLESDKDKDKESPLSEYTDEDIEEMLEEEDVEWLRQADLGKFKTKEELAQAYKNLDSSDKLVFPKIKILATRFNMTPEDFVAYLEKQAGGKPAEETPKPVGKSKEVVALEESMGRTHLDLRFMRFQQKMLKQEIEIPDELQSEIEKRLPSVVYGKTSEQLKKFDPFEKAYRLYLFEMSDTEDADSLKEKIDLHQARLEKKRRQLGMPAGTKSKKETKKDIEKQKSWGDYGKL